jgi:hypothetical protein
MKKLPVEARERLTMYSVILNIKDVQQLQELRLSDVALSFDYRGDDCRKQTLGGLLVHAKENIRNVTSGSGKEFCNHPHVIRQA